MTTATSTGIVAGGERGYVIGLVGALMALEDAGYAFKRVAGTSAGAIAGSLVAAPVRKPALGGMLQLKHWMDGLHFTDFMPEGKVHAFFDHDLGKMGELTANAAILADRMGLYPGTYLETWLSPKLAQCGVTTFEQLKITEADIPGLDLPPNQCYSLLAAGSASVPIPAPDGSTVSQSYAAGTVTFVDGGMLRNFPIDAFQPLSGTPAWPTIGIKLSAFQTAFGPTQACHNSVEVAVSCLRTMVNEWDDYEVEDTTAARTVFVGNAGISATDFGLSAAQQAALFLSGVAAGTNFVIEMGESGRGVPKSAREAAGRRRTAVVL
ncbi:MAG: patatin-like phospholipase family protein [Acidimicrobiales bacterium]